MLIVVSLTTSITLLAQADNEIQVYASPTIGEEEPLRSCIIIIHFKGPKNLSDPKDARWLNHTLEITHGIAKNVEIGFYTFIALSPDGKYQYLGTR